MLGMLTVGDQFPPCKLNGIDANNDFVEVEIVEGYQPLKHDWTVVYFYPKDFTFICPTEIAGMDILVDHANVIGISGDNEFCKSAWKQANGVIREIKHTLAAIVDLSYLLNLALLMLRKVSVIVQHLSLIKIELFNTCQLMD